MYLMNVRDIQQYWSDLETKSFLLFYLLCKYRFKYFHKKDIQQYQARRAKAVVQYAVTHSKFFHHHYSGYDLNNIWSLPTVNKKIMMENLTDYNTVGLSKEEIVRFCLEVEESRDFSRRLKEFNVGMSSGTSGNKGVEIVSLREEKYMKAALFARFDFPKKEKINLAFILRVSAPAFNLGKYGHTLTYISQLLSIDEIKHQLEKIQPNVVSAPASMLKILAKEVERGHISIKPKRLISYAEVLYSDVQEYLEQVFGCSVHQIYKCTEGPIAISCPSGSLHINEDLVAIETLMEDGSVTPIGEPCQKLVVTDLHKTSQPIIRYELNDIITLSSHTCGCGSAFRVIQNIQGRADDLFWAKNIKTGEWQFIFPDYISRAIITSSDMIDEYQAIQNSPSDIVVRLQLKDNTLCERFEEKQLIHNIQAVFLRYHCKKPKISLVFEKPQLNTYSHKLIRIHRNFSPDTYYDCS